MYLNRNPQELLKVEGEKPENRKLLCNFNQQVCAKDDFEIRRDEFGFVSYLFKGKSSYVSGRELALNLTGIICNDCLIDGLKVIIHNRSIDPGYYGGVSNRGMNVAPGLFNEIKVNRVFSSKLDNPYNVYLKDVRSLDSFDSDLYRFIIQNTSYSYRQQDCFDYCIGREMLKRLNHSGIYNYKEIDLYLIMLNDLKSHNITSNLFNNLTRGGLIKECLPECPLECNSIKYDLAYSSTKLSEFSLNQLNNISSDDLVYLNVYYENLEYTDINQVIKIDEWDLISNIGGNLGLFIGFTFLNLVELIEFVIEIVIISVEKKTSSKVNINSIE